MSYGDLARLVTLRPFEDGGLGLRAGRRRRSPFRAAWSNTVEQLTRELRAVDARDVVLEVDMREQDFRIDGLPRATARAASPGVRLSFVAKSVAGSPALRYAVDTFDDWQDNVRAIALGLNALRAVDRYGVTKRGEQYAGWKQLGAGGSSVEVERGRELIRKHGGAREALKATHPDRGGDANDFAAVDAARQALS